MKVRFQFATLCYSGAVFMVFGFIVLTVASNLSSMLNGNTNLYLRVWGESIVMTVLGLVLFLAAFLVSYPKEIWLAVGGFLGAVSSVVGTLVAIDLLSVVVQYQGYAQTSQETFFEGILEVCFVAVLLVGFPLGMIGSLGGLRNSQAGADSATSEHTTE